MEAEGFIAFIGPFWTMTEGDETRVGFVAMEKHRNRSGVVHGGMLASLADRAMGMACWRSSENSRLATIQLDLHHLDAAHVNEFVEASCRVVRNTRFVIFAEANIFSGVRLVATGKGVWKVRAR